MSMTEEKVEDRETITERLFPPGWTQRNGSLNPSVALRRPVVVLAVVTEALQAQNLSALDAQIEQGLTTFRAMEADARRRMLGITDPALLNGVGSQIQHHRRAMEQNVKGLQAKRKEVEGWELGTKVLTATYETEVTVAVGQTFEERMTPVQITLMDGVVTGIEG